MADDEDFQRGPYQEGDEPAEPDNDPEPAGEDSLADAITKEAADGDPGDPDDGDSGDDGGNDADTSGGDGMARKKCPHCDKMFKNAQGLGIHIGRSHPDKAGADPKPPAKPPASGSNKASKKKTAKKKKGKKGESTGPWIILGKDDQGILVDDSEKLSDTYQEMLLEIKEDDEDSTVRIFEVAKEVMVQTEVTIVDV